MSRLEVVIVAMIVALAGLAVVGVRAEILEKKRLMAQCAADGRKEYECESMLRSPPTTVVPVIVPAGGR